MGDNAISRVEAALSACFDELWPILAPRVTDDEWEAIGVILRKTLDRLSPDLET